MIILKRFESPCGILKLGSFSDHLCLCAWEDGQRQYRIQERLRRFLNTEFCKGSSDVIELTISQLREYFEGKRRIFDIPFFYVGTYFQKQVWQHLTDIPYGLTASYLDIANAIGSLKAVRAVATAIGDNAISILTPCHRIIGNNGSLTGYAGGLEIKKFLLDLENANPSLVQ